jgi:Carboxypeptidase regulatory-like domain/TonB dependent receptor
MKSLFRIVLFIFLVSVGSSFGQGVDRQQISGTVTDPAGAVIANAQILVTNEATKISRTVESNGSGNYVVLDVPVGTYTLTITSNGFKKSIVSGVAVDIGGKPSVDVALSVGTVGESVEIKADAVLIQTTSAEVGGVISSTEATSIQLNGRNYIQLLTLQPGVSLTVASGFAIGSGTYGVSGSAQSVNGVRTDSSNYFIDGVDNKDNGGGGNNFVNISPDALQQFRNVASSYDASYGGTAGATVSVAVKSGGRSFHGGAYEYIRNDAIQAYPFRALSTYGQAPIKTPLRYNDFGWTLGGPVWIPGLFNQNRDKLFFFAGQEFKRLRQSSISTAAVPTPTQLATAIATGPTTANGLALAKTILTDPSGNFRYLSVNPLNVSEYLIKIDYNLNAHNQISGHFIHDNEANFGNPTNFVVYDRTIPGLTSSVQWTHTFDAKTVNTATASYSGNIINEGGNIRANPQFGKSILRTDYGLTYATLFNASPIIPQVGITSFGNPSVTPRQFDNYQRIYAVKDDLSRVLGNHSVRVGAYFWRARKNQTAPPALNGTLSFANLAGLVSGNFTGYTEGSAIPQIQARFSQFETYVQDDWTVSRRLTLNLGLRWQYMPPIASWPGNTSFFDPTYYDPTKAAVLNAAGTITSNPFPYNGLVLPGTGFSDKAKQVVPASVYNNPQVLALFHGLPAGIINNSYNTFAPRVGFAYDLSGRGETVLHAGYGLSYERVEGNYIYGASSQVPFISNVSLNAGNVDSLTSSTAAPLPPQTIGNTADRNLAPPRVHNYSLGVQQKLFSNTSVELNYVGSHSSNLLWLQNLNQGVAGTEQANPGVARNTLRPYKGYGDINQYTNGAHSNYNALQARFQTHFSKGGLATVSYTWSQALSNGSAYNYQPQDSKNLYADYGPASFNQPKILSVSYVYPLPFWQNEHTWYKQALGGWQVSGITRIASGLPINVTMPTLSGGPSFSGAAVAGNLTTVAQRPNLIPGVSPYSKNGKQYLNPAAFALPALGTYGNLGYDALKGPLFNNWDATLQKNYTIHEQVKMEFRAEMFNVPNHLSYFTVNGALTGQAYTGGSYPSAFAPNSTAVTFGQATGAADPRTMEFALRLNF